MSLKNQIRDWWSDRPMEFTPLRDWIATWSRSQALFLLACVWAMLALFVWAEIMHRQELDMIERSMGEPTYEIIRK